MQGRTLIKAIKDEKFLLAAAEIKNIYVNNEKTDEQQIQLILFLADEENLNKQQVRVKVDYNNKNLNYVKNNLNKLINLDNFENIDENKAFDFNSKINVSYITFSAKNFVDNEEIEVFK